MSFDRKFSFYYMLILYGVTTSIGTLTPSGTVSVDCGRSKTFTCDVTGIGTNPIAGWIIMNLVNIDAQGTNGVLTATNNGRITTTATDGNTPTSTITIHDFTMNDENGTIQCINTGDLSDQGIATITVEPLPPPSNPTATTVGHNCTVITLQWEEPDTPSDINSAVSCTPSAAACGACTSSPCYITGLELNTDFNFTVTLNSGMCGSSMATTTARTLGVPQLLNVDTQLKTCTSVDITWEQQPTTTTTTSVAVTYCPTSSPNCGASTTCTINPCTIYGLTPNTTYDIIVIPNNNCGTGTAIAAIVTTPPDSPYMETPPTSCLGLSGSWYNVPVGITFAVTFTVTSLVSSSVTAVVMYFVCIRKKRSEVVKDTGTGGDIYEDPDRSDDIKMDPSPAYQTVPSVCVQ